MSLGFDMRLTALAAGDLLELFDKSTPAAGWFRANISAR
jgi:hypothetical protein